MPSSNCVLDWVIFGLSAFLVLESAVGALYIAAFWPSHKRPVAVEFNYLCRARFLFQLLSAAFGAVQLLRLQVFWGPDSVWIPGGWQTSTLCRAYIAVEYGILEPALLLLSLFACVYTIQAPSNKGLPPLQGAASGNPLHLPSGSSASSRTGAATAGAIGNGVSKAAIPGGERGSDTDQGPSALLSAPSSTARFEASHDCPHTLHPHSHAQALPDSKTDLSCCFWRRPPSAIASDSGPTPSLPASQHPNFNIVFFALGFTLPCCVAQLVCALFTRIFELDYGGVELFHIMFATYEPKEAEYCPPLGSTTHCVWCVFPLLSTLITAAFTATYLLSLWIVTTRIAAATINRALIQRVRLLQVLVTLSVSASVACRGVTTVFEPHELGFQLLRLGHVVCSLVTLLSISYLLMLRPVLDSRRADLVLRRFASDPERGLMGLGGEKRGAGKWKVAGVEAFTLPPPFTLPFFVSGGLDQSLGEQPTALIGSPTCAEGRGRDGEEGGGCVDSLSPSPQPSPITLSSRKLGSVLDTVSQKRASDQDFSSPAPTQRDQGQGGEGQ